MINHYRIDLIFRFLISFLSLNIIILLTIPSDSMYVENPCILRYWIADNDFSNISLYSISVLTAFPMIFFLHFF